MDSTAEKNKYATCYANEYGGCGPYLRYRKPVDELFEITDLTNDTKPHLVRLKLKHTKSRDTSKLSGKCLIKSRLSKFYTDGKKISAYHRYTLGVEWKQPITCQHPDHDQPKDKNYF